MAEPQPRRFSRLRALLGGGLLLLAVGCRGGPDAEQGQQTGRAPLAELPADSAFAELERWLLEASPLQIQFIVESEGAVETDLRGALALLEGNGLSLTADGEFAGTPQTLRLDADGQRITLVGSVDSAAAPSAVPQPPALREAVVIGFTRMGVLHNLARLTAGDAPDHMEGAVREWVQVDSLAWGPRDTIEGAEMLSLDFRIVVGGMPSGNARLYLDAQTEQPIRRMQTVQFPEGEMRVTETYEIF